MIVFVTAGIINDVNTVKGCWTGNQGLGELDEDNDYCEGITIFKLGGRERCY